MSTSDDEQSETKVPREHRVEAAPVGSAFLRSVTEDGGLVWQRDIGLQHYQCACGEHFEGRNIEEQIRRHLIEVGVLER